ncbi:O-antigen polymerase [Thiomicrorhabdus sediminis]|uniref:Oligosaccharide repeat unit polymerase n=1 Tax=Thiomicrorhabdus sediminis TaxID=2580412 RepID=A0A4P9K5L8_9GAMM|nr:O-antigen polymerase [Thiomicrorhabdus sediminis]QCU89547.1 oligosaccharide repeat unit polymerase [Thiomicrorhabdus sediminis]
MIALSFFLFLFAVFYLLSKLGFKFSLLHFLLLGFTFKLTGLFLMGVDDGEYTSFEYFLYFLVSFLLGIAVASALNQRSIKKIERKKVIRIEGFSSFRIDFFFLSIVLIGFCVYHYFIVGIPLFSEEVETLRFQASHSGFFGLPSRIVNFSILFYLVLLLVLYYFKFINIKVLLVFIIFPILVILFAGFKSSIVVIIHLLILTYRLTDNRIKFFYMVVALVPVVIYVFFTFSQYKTLQDQDLFVYILNRLTVINANTFDYIIDVFHSDYSFGYGYGVLNDLVYPFMRLIGNSDVYTVNTALSASFYGVELGDFTVPVTPSIFGYFYLEFGFIGAVILSFLSGWLYVYTYVCANKSRTMLKASLFLFSEYMLFIAYGSGNPVYVLVNYSIGIGIIVLIYLMIKFLRQLLFSSHKAKVVYSRDI